MVAQICAKSVAQSCLLLSIIFDLSELQIGRGDLFLEKLLELKYVNLLIEYSNRKHAATDVLLIGQSLYGDFSYLLILSFDLLTDGCNLASYAFNSCKFLHPVFLQATLIAVDGVQFALYHLSSCSDQFDLVFGLLELGIYFVVFVY